MNAALYGGVLLSAGFDKVALVRSEGKPSWLFPCGPVRVEDGASEQLAASSVVERQLGLRVAFSDDVIEVDLLPGVQVKLYIATGLPESHLSGRQGLTATWAPLDAVVHARHPYRAQASLAPYLEPLKAWLRRHQGAAPSSGNAQDGDQQTPTPPVATCSSEDQVLAQLLEWRQDTWAGVTPLRYLDCYCTSNSLPTPCYNAFQQRRTQRAAQWHSTCILPHLGLQVTTCSSFKTLEQANENAALATVVLLEAGVPAAELLSVVARVGRRPQLESAIIQERTKRRAAQHLGEAGLGGGAGGVGGGAGEHDGRSKKKRKSIKDVEAIGKPSQPKNPVQELKELCEARKWPAAIYAFDALPDGSFACSVELPSVLPSVAHSQPAPNMREAKRHGATLLLQLLRQPCD